MEQQCDRVLIQHNRRVKLFNVQRNYWGVNKVKFLENFMKSNFNNVSIGKVMIITWKCILVLHCQFCMFIISLTLYNQMTTFSTSYNTKCNNHSNYFNEDNSPPLRAEKQQQWVGLRSNKQESRLFTKIRAVIWKTYTYIKSSVDYLNVNVPFKNHRLKSLISTGSY